MMAHLRWSGSGQIVLVLGLQGMESHVTTVIMAITTITIMTMASSEVHIHCNGEGGIGDTKSNKETVAI